VLEGKKELEEKERHWGEKKNEKAVKGAKEEGFSVEGEKQSRIWDRFSGGVKGQEDAIVEATEKGDRKMETLA